ncbi:MAG: glycosyltransferase family 4 protein [Candidatus Competibacterales bacterium]|nr:glycosyltransferase family 4 protein [Candidatus Competibacterales bacterium]
MAATRLQRPLTVLQILPELEGGGVERGTLELGRHLVEQGQRSLVLAAGGRLAAELVAAGSTHIDWPVGRKSPATLRFVPRLRRLLVDERVDILHVRSRLPAWIAWLAWRGLDPARRPWFVSTVHGLYSVGRYSAIMTRGERVIAVSETVRRYLRAHYPGLDPFRIRVIPRGVDPVAFPHGYRPDREWLAAWQRTHPRPGGARVLTLPGRLTRLKGHHDFIDLLAALRRRGHEVYGLIVGGEHSRRRRYAEELRERVRREGLAQRVRFTGQRGDLREIMAVSDLVLALSTQPEAFGRTALEALSLGVPVVVYDHGGVGEILATVYPSGRVPLRDGAALAATVERHLAAPPPVPAAHPFPLATMLERTLALYRELTTGTP